MGEGPRTFAAEQVEALREIVGDWLLEGFTTPPYTPEQYAIFEALEMEEYLREAGPVSALYAERLQRPVGKEG